ncbi:hypothetical protein QFZ35_003229 [Arthrobacter ulcerisalmonis]|nr:hypothetical protein [Arthrobacter ulcerisalmonis]MDQ0664731.1 hypothetical protein [Arthrobacter ulcerisalmonis]
MTAGVDTSFNYHDDSGGKDPDKYSATLKEHHKILWSKDLPTGGRFDLLPEDDAYLVHRSKRGVFFLASDAITTRLLDKAARVIRTIAEAEIPPYGGYTAGSALVFPGNIIGRKMTINGARGFHPRIADRFDLTLECIRRHYLGIEQNPLGDVLNRYGNFFQLFGDFDGYVEFFLLQDLLEDDGATIKYFHHFDDFKTPAVPKTKDEYLEYLCRKNAFIAARNRTIDVQP